MDDDRPSDQRDRDRSERQSTRHDRSESHTRITLIVLSISVVVMVLVGLTVGIFLLTRTNDQQAVQNQIESRVSQAEKALCAYMEQRSVITTTGDDKLLAAQAAILIRRYGCETKGTLQPPVTRG